MIRAWSMRISFTVGHHHRHPGDGSEDDDSDRRTGVSPATLEALSPQTRSQKKGRKLFFHFFFFFLIKLSFSVACFFIISRTQCYNRRNKNLEVFFLSLRLREISLISFLASRFVHMLYSFRAFLDQSCVNLCLCSFLFVVLCLYERNIYKL